MARPRKRADSASVLEQATIVANAIHEQDQAAASQSEADRIQRINLPLSRIYPRAEDTRPLRDSHVEDLAESIGALGLIELLVVDQKGVLLAGGHRLAAIQLLKETNLELYQQQFPDDIIAVRVMPFDAEAEPERSLQVELAENEKRVNYLRDQIEQLAERLRSLNYRDIPGRPKEGETALGSALAVAIGVSARFGRRVLAKQQTDQYKNTRDSVPNFSKLKALRKIEAAIRGINYGRPKEVRIDYSHVRNTK
ncbi:ParB domain protein nuclease (plasmid) [Gloeocapsa sp. PCC 7428]|uniref:ParB N-terminal domain-containing protein n=1 Tax=Gloeocapsa sp. PCC 7428 TaxID=1173026 RepID=UPI0002A5D579|nr:ParB N-terminal domain-containing protein [Gloeocapsa sp. PCC 7428]AFZ33347.1 ParB domain protein nuclease [Gloeocapsa sp. PCC 7428]